MHNSRSERGINQEHHHHNNKAQYKNSIHYNQRKSGHTLKDSTMIH
jgi:hypothetical protein